MALFRFLKRLLPEHENFREFRFSEVRWEPAQRATALTPHTLLFVGTPGKPKWLRFLCPCGCGDEQALNLMRSHYPHWTVTFHGRSAVTVRPSVHALKCGAHFWVRRNAVYWC
jgi:Family of unknown function (DUF6527)